VVEFALRSVEQMLDHHFSFSMSKKLSYSLSSKTKKEKLSRNELINKFIKNEMKLKRSPG